MGLFGREKREKEVKKPKFNARKCHVCNKEFREQIQYEEHTKILHPFRKPCVKCNGTMIVPEKKYIKIMGHFLSTDLGGAANMYVCDVCDYIEFYNYHEDWFESNT